MAQKVSWAVGLWTIQALVLRDAVMEPLRDHTVRPVLQELV